MRSVALDAMGGDRAPVAEVEAALQIVRENIAEVALVGDEPRLKSELNRLGAKTPPTGLTLHHAPDVIAMDDHPALAAKGKKNSSMRVAFDLVQSGQAEAVVSAGNSGAMLACGLLVLKRIRGLDRPAILTTFPTVKEVCALLDMGANVECKPQNLAQFAVLGATFARLRHGKSRPKVALLSNGSEASKGTELTRAAHALLSACTVAEPDFQYCGYVEGHELFSGDLDVVVTDGFTGNIVLKTAEGASAAAFQLLRKEILATRTGQLGGRILKGTFQNLKKKLDYDEHGGAPLVGVSGVAVICHGRSSVKAIKNGVQVAVGLVNVGLQAAIASAFAKHAPLWEKLPAQSPAK